MEKKHGVILGSGYKNNQACASFIVYITQVQRELLVTVLAKAKYFAIEADGSTDPGNMEEELFLVMYLDPHAKDGKIHIRDKFLAIRQAASANVGGLFECLARALAIQEFLVGRGS